MENFTFYSPTRIIFGKGTEKEVGGKTSKYGKKVLLHYGGGSIKRTGLYDRIMESLKKEGIDTFISAIFKTPQEAELGSPLFLDMVEGARILYDKNGFFKKRLDRLRKRLKELGAKRVWRGNIWHWVLKPDYRPGDVIEL